MKIIELISLLVAATLLGCSVDKSEQEQSREARKIEFTLTTSQMSRVVTDAAFKSTFEEGDKVGLFIVKTGAELLSTGNYADNFALTYTNGKWVAEAENLFFPLDGSSLDFYTYYPYRANIDPLSIDFEVNGEQSDGTIYSKNDFLYGKTTNKRNQSVSISLAHLFSLVNVEVVKGEYMPPLSADLKVNLLGCTNAASINLSSGTVTNSTTSKGDIAMGRVETSGSKYTFRAIIPTQGIELGAKLFTFEQSTTGSAFKFEYTNPAKVDLVAGDVQKWRITLTGKPVPAHIYAVGDAYPYTGTPVGVVYEVSNEGKNGKVVSLTEIRDRWGTGKKVEATDNVPLIASLDDGAAATRNLINIRKGAGNFASDYAVFSWLYVTMNKSDLDGAWYMPAKKELMSLCASVNALSYGDIESTWAVNQPMPGFDSAAALAARTAFNTKLTSLGGLEIGGQCWASTEISGTAVWSIKMDTGVLQDTKQKTDTYGRLRPIMKF